MIVLTIRNINDEIMNVLHERAALHSCSVDDEAKSILEDAVRSSMDCLPLGDRLQQMFKGLGEIKIPPRRPARPPPSFAQEKRKAK